MDTKTVLAFIFGVIAGAVALFLGLILFTTESKPQGPSAKIELSKEALCLSAAAENARNIYAALTVERGNIANRMEFEALNKSQIEKHNTKQSKYYALAGAVFENCVVWGGEIDSVKPDLVALAKLDIGG